MQSQQIVRAWTDPEFFHSLSDEDRALVPENPAGMVEVDSGALANVLGASHSTCFTSCHNSSECCESCWTGGCCCCC